MKTCILCGETKPLSEFYAHSRTADGLQGNCKVCQKAKSKWRRVTCKEECASYGKKYRAAHRDAFNEYHKKYRASQKGFYNSAEYRKRWRKDNPEKHAAHQTVTNHVARGTLVRGECDVCGAKEVHAHHSDYSKPLNVRWLCPLHHKEVHYATKG